MRGIFSLPLIVMLALMAALIAPPSAANACDDAQQLNAECLDDGYSQNLGVDDCQVVQQQAVQYQTVSNGRSRNFQRSRQRVVIVPQQQQFYAAPQQFYAPQQFIQQPQFLGQGVYGGGGLSLGIGSGFGFQRLGIGGFGLPQAIIINRDRGRRGPPRDRDGRGNGRNVQRQRSVQRNR